MSDGVLVPPFPDRRVRRGRLCRHGRQFTGKYVTWKITGNIVYNSFMRISVHLAFRIFHQPEAKGSRVNSSSRSGPRIEGEHFKTKLWFDVFISPQPRDNAELCNDPSSFVLR